MLNGRWWAPDRAHGASGRFQIKIDPSFPAHCKVPHLQRLGYSPVFTDISKMGDDKAMVHGMDTRQPVPACALGYCGFSCKDWSSFISNAEDVAEHIIKVLEALLKDPQCKPSEEETFGTTLPTLLGLLSYIARKKPGIFILENTIKVERILAILKEIFAKMGYVFASRFLEPEMFKVPNSRLSLHLWIVYLL